MQNLSSRAFEDAIAKDKDAVIIDVRTPAECAEGVIPGAINLDIFDGQRFEAGIASLDKSKNYYVYCRSGGRSMQACGYMQSVGIENTYNLAGGMGAWSGPVAALQS